MRVGERKTERREVKKLVVVSNVSLVAMEPLIYMKLNFLSKAIFSFKKIHSKVSHQILRNMYGVLNVDEKKLITQLGEKSRAKTFEPN